MSDDEGVAPMQMEEDDEHEQQQQQEADAEAEVLTEEQEHDEAAEDGDAEEEEESKEPGGDATAAASPAAPLKRPMTAYFLFLAAERPGIIAALDVEDAAQAEAGAAVKSRSKNVALIGKMLGDKWKALTEEEKQPYITRHQELKDAYDAAILADPSLAPAKRGGKPSSSSSGNQHEQGALSHDILLPLSRVKKIMDLDSGDAGSAGASAASGSSTKVAPKCRVSKEGLLMMEKATEHFIAWVSARAHHFATSSKRRGLKSSDLESLVKTAAPLEFLRAPLKRDFERMAIQEAAQGEERRERFEEAKRKKAKAKEDAAAAAGEGEQKEGQDEGAGAAAGADGDEADASAVTPSPVKPKPKPVRTIDSMFSKAAK